MLEVSGRSSRSSTVSVSRSMFDELSEGVFRRRYESLDLNVGIVLGEDGVLVVDTRASRREGRELFAEIQRLTEKPVRWVVNTHWHWDHVLGNSVFDDAEVVGHELCRKVLSDRAEETREAAKKWLPAEEHEDIAATEVIPPSRVFAERLSIDVGRSVELRHHGRGHTDADITVTVADVGVVFMGDLVEEGAPPAFGDSYPLEWPSTLRQALDSSEPIVVPGHGDVVGPSFAATQLAELRAVAEMSQKYLIGDLELEEAVSAGPYPPNVMRIALARAEVSS